jgi:plastocyanin
MEDSCHHRGCHVKWTRLTVEAPPASHFSPGNQTVTHSNPVLFKNNSNDVHSAVWHTAGAPPGSPTINTGGGTWSVVMPNPGTFAYHCGAHGPQMSGVITVS